MEKEFVFYWLAIVLLVTKVKIPQTITARLVIQLLTKMMETESVFHLIHYVPLDINGIKKETQTRTATTVHLPTKEMELLMENVS